jgi:hypothetical protein
VAFFALRSSRSRSDFWREVQYWAIGIRSREWVLGPMAPSRVAGHADSQMSDQRVPRERPPEGTSASPSAASWTLALWVVAAFLGAFVAAHYFLQRALAGGSYVASAATSIRSLL